jgi:hypothetical protein
MKYLNCFCGEVLDGRYGRTSTCCQDHALILNSCDHDRKKAKKKWKRALKMQRIENQFLLGVR